MAPKVPRLNSRVLTVWLLVALPGLAVGVALVLAFGQARLSDSYAHHLQQLASLREACAAPRTAFELLPVMFGRPLRGFHRMLAMGEAVAHLNYLLADGLLAREIGGDGVARFVSA